MGWEGAAGPDDIPPDEGGAGLPLAGEAGPGTGPVVDAEGLDQRNPMLARAVTAL